MAQLSTGISPPSAFLRPSPPLRYHLLQSHVHPDDEVCLCFHVSLRKIRNFLQRENPPVASLISECLGAGTGCMWCVPFLKHLHSLHQHGKEPDLRVSPEEYMRTRLEYHKTNKRDACVVQRATDSGSGAETNDSQPN